MAKNESLRKSCWRSTLVFRPRIELLGDFDALCVGWDGARGNFDSEA
jgi:hypothetical protein